MMRRALRGVVLDLDGTLRVPPSLDLGLLRKTVSRDSRERSAEQVQMALQAIESAQRQQGCGSAISGAKEVCNFIDLVGLHRGMITLSSRADAEKFQAELNTCRSFSPIFGNEYFAVKPSPDPLLHMCMQWGVEPSEVLMVGDSPRYDVACGNSAGALTCLVDPLFRYKLDQLPPQLRPTFKWIAAAQSISLSNCALLSAFEKAGSLGDSRVVSALARQ